MLLPWSSFMLAAVLGVVSAIGAGTVSRLVGGWNAAVFAWEIAFAAAGTLLVLAAPVWLLQRRSARYSVIARCVVSLCLCGVLLALGLPVFFIVPIWTPEGVSLATIAAGALAFNGYPAHGHFLDRWEASGEAASDRSVRNGTIDLAAFAKLLRLDPPSLISSRHAVFNLALGAVVMGSMLLGLNLRHAFPTFAALAWGVPALMLASWVAQPVVLAFHECRVIRLLEARLGSTLRASEAT